MAYNQFIDSCFASTGDPYGLVDEKLEPVSLNAFYGTFNHIWVKIDGDKTSNPVIVVTAIHSGKEKRFDGADAQSLLDRIYKDIEVFGETHAAIYRNTYHYVL